nr:MAG TPA: hypothetical protein [Caudoviricetes sp.]
MKKRRRTYWQTPLILRRRDGTHGRGTDDCAGGGATETILSREA